MDYELNDDERAIADEISFEHGKNVTAIDTVPFALWTAYQALLWPGIGFAESMKSIIEVGGDTDTVSAMVGGIVGNKLAIPQEMLDRTEPLPSDINDSL